MRIERLPAARGRTWVIDGFRLLRRAPLALLALSFLYLLMLMLTTVLPLIGPFAPMLAILSVVASSPRRRCCSRRCASPRGGSGAHCWCSA